MSIHPTAIIEDGAILGEGVSVGPYSIIESGAVIGDGCRIDSSARIFGTTQMGAHNRVCHGVTLGSEPQDLSFTPDKARPLIIGERNHFKENVNISCGIKSADGTRIGDDNYWMAFSHAGHDCRVGNHNIFANTATLAGHVEIADHCFLSGQVAVHQFCRIGSYVLVAGVTGVAQDVPPYALADGHRARFIDLNLVGLKRNGFSPEQRRRIKAAYRLILRSGLRLAEALARAEIEYPGPETAYIVEFIRSSRRGVISFG